MSGGNKDWRIDLAKRLEGVRLQFLQYQPPTKDWDHDHCAACMAKFADTAEPDVLHEGYTTCEDYRHAAKYEWICKDCFAELKDEMRWTVTE